MDASALTGVDVVSSILAPLGTFAVVPAGAGLVGSARPVRSCDGTEYPEYPANGPPRSVYFPEPFMMGSVSVTVGAFRAVCPEVFQANSPVFVLPESGEVEGRWRSSAFAVVNCEDDLPVVGVTWSEAVVFCNRLVHQYRVAARLPAEDEWEYAARAGVQTVYCWGDDPCDSDAYAWTRRNSGMKVHRGGMLAPNAWGLHDLAGNVWEWCANDFHGARPGEIVRRSIRGGAAFNHSTAVRASHRWWQEPHQRNGFLGFRVLIDIGNGR